MFSTGFSDASGGSEYDNLLLAARRARTVKIALVARGIPANQVQLRSFGQSDPVERVRSGRCREPPRDRHVGHHVSRSQRQTRHQCGDE